MQTHASPSPITYQYAMLKKNKGYKYDRVSKRSMCRRGVIVAYYHKDMYLNSFIAGDEDLIISKSSLKSMK